MILERGRKEGGKREERGVLHALVRNVPAEIRTGFRRENRCACKSVKSLRFDS